MYWKWFMAWYEAHPGGSLCIRKDCLYFLWVLCSVNHNPPLSVLLQSSVLFCIITVSWEKSLKQISISKNYYNFTHFASCSLNLLLLRAHLRVWEFHDEVNLASLRHFIHPSKWSLFYTSRGCSNVTQSCMWLIWHGLCVLSHHIYQLATVVSQYLVKPDCVACLSDIICSSSLSTPRWVWGQ